MSELILWKNQQMNKLRKDIDHLFDRFCFDFGVDLFRIEAAKGISLNMSQHDDTLFVKVNLPGIHPKDLDISLTSDTLTIRGQTRDETIKGNGYYRRVERRSGSFSRTIRLPCRVKVDDIRATYKNGVLDLVMPKWKPEKARGIKVELE